MSLWFGYLRFCLISSEPLAKLNIPGMNCYKYKGIFPRLQVLCSRWEYNLGEWKYIVSTWRALQILWGVSKDALSVLCSNDMPSESIIHLSFPCPGYIRCSVRCPIAWQCWQSCKDCPKRLGKMCIRYCKPLPCSCKFDSSVGQ